MHSGDSAIVKANASARGAANVEVFQEDGMIELKDLTGWREKQMQLQTPDLETPIQEEVKDFPEMLIGELVMSDEEEDDITPTTTDDSLLDDSPDNSWASININPDGSIDLDLSEGETDNIEDIISLLSESSTSSIPPNLVYPIGETTKCKFDSPGRVRKCDRPVVLTPITRDFDVSLSDIHNNNSPKRPSTPFRPKPNPPSRHHPASQQIIPTNGSPKATRIAQLRASEPTPTHPAIKPPPDDNRPSDTIKRRNKLKLPPPRKPYQLQSPHTTSLATGTQTLPNLIARNKLKCSRCSHQCAPERGVFYCDTCVDVHRVQSAFVLEVFADRSTSDESGAEQTTCYGIRIGAGLLPVIVMFLSLLVCSVFLLADSVMSNVCGS